MNHNIDKNCISITINPIPNRKLVPPVKVNENGYFVEGNNYEIKK